nr:dentin phosphoprotein [Haemonchus contortus]
MKYLLSLTLFTVTAINMSESEKCNTDEAEHRALIQKNIPHTYCVKIGFKRSPLGRRCTIKSYEFGFSNASEEVCEMSPGTITCHCAGNCTEEMAESVENAMSATISNGRLPRKRKRCLRQIFVSWVKNGMSRKKRQDGASAATEASSDATEGEGDGGPTLDFALNTASDDLNSPDSKNSSIGAEEAGSATTFELDYRQPSDGMALNNSSESDGGGDGPAGVTESEGEGDGGATLDFALNTASDDLNSPDSKNSSIGAEEAGSATTFELDYRQPADGAAVNNSSESDGGGDGPAGVTESGESNNPSDSGAEEKSEESVTEENSEQPPNTESGEDSNEDQSTADEGHENTPDNDGSDTGESHDGADTGSTDDEGQGADAHKSEESQEVAKEKKSAEPIGSRHYYAFYIIALMYLFAIKA